MRCVDIFKTVLVASRSPPAAVKGCGMSYSAARVKSCDVVTKNSCAASILRSFRIVPGLWGWGSVAADVGATVVTAT